MMKAKILSSVSFDDELLAEELRKIVRFDFNSSYSEFAVGKWENCVLWNATGSQHDSIAREYHGRAEPTELGEQLGYLNSIVCDTFNFKYIRWIRIFLVKQGLIIPHKDYLEMKKGFTRVHIPLQTDSTCLHSEGNAVYHMRKGEVWFIDGTQVHSACSLSHTTRVSLCIDFEYGIPFEKLFIDAQKSNPFIVPYRVKRDCISEEYEKALRDLGYIISPENFNDVVGLLAKVHFIKHVHAAAMYDWLIEIAQKSYNKHLINKAIETKKFFLGERHLEQVLVR